jgi:5'-methylthioadenosine phosphorylase
MLGIIGGSGLDDPEILTNSRDERVETPWGEPHSPIRVGDIAGTEVALVARHGRQHTVPPTAVNNRAHIRALSDLGCTAIIATTAVGSLREEIRRGDLVILDQFIDFTRLRPLTFFEEFEPGKAAHTAMADPFHRNLRNELIRGCEEAGYPFHPDGTVVTIEGPRFSTRGESKMFRSWGADVINMSIAPECALANEAGIPYAAVAMSTDYDCWKIEEEPVSWNAILEVFASNVGKVTDLLITVIPRAASFFS